MSQRALALALVTTLALPVTAHAGPAAEPTGFACGLVTTNDITGLVMSTTDVQTGIVFAGPVTYPDYAEDGRQLVEVDVDELVVDLNPTSSAYLPAQSAGIECIVKTGPTPGTGVELVRVYMPSSGPVASGSAALTFVEPPIKVFVCTLLHWYDPDGGRPRRTTTTSARREGCSARSRSARSRVTPCRTVSGRTGSTRSTSEIDLAGLVDIRGDVR